MDQSLKEKLLGLLGKSAKKKDEKPREVKPEDLKLVGAGGGEARKAADAIVNRKKQIDDALGEGK